MAECKKCLYFDICKMYADDVRGDYEDSCLFEDCSNFKNKTDLVEVVRCKDCKFNVANMEKDPLNITDYSGDDIVRSCFLTDGLDPNNYCSRGKRTPKERGGEK